MWSMNRLQLHGWALLKSFYIRRAFRIYPLSILCVIAVVSFEIPILPWETFSVPAIHRLVSNLLLTMNLTHVESVLGPLWSLPLEMQMYLLLPLIFMFVNAGNLIKRIVIVYIAVFLSAWLLPDISSRFSFALFFPCFMAGILAYGLQSKVKESIHGYLWPVFLAVIIALYIIIEELVPGIHHNILQWFICMSVGLMIPVFSSYQTHGSTQSLTFLRNIPTESIYSTVSHYGFLVTN